jgi:hypothetical protein
VTAAGVAFVFGVIAGFCAVGWLRAERRLRRALYYRPNWSAVVRTDEAGNIKIVLVKSPSPQDWGRGREVRMEYGTLAPRDDLSARLDEMLAGARELANTMNETQVGQHR